MFSVVGHYTFAGLVIAALLVWRTLSGRLVQALGRAAVQCSANLNLYRGKTKSRFDADLRIVGRELAVA